MENEARPSTKNRHPARPARREGSRRRGPVRRGASAPRLVAEEEVRVHLPLVRQVVQQVQGALPASVEFDEIMSWGIDGLLDAVRKYDASKGTHFQTYARIRIRGAILDQLRSLDWVSRTTRQKANQLVRKIQELEHSLGRQATQDELAASLGLNLEKLHELMGEVGDLALVSLEDVAFGRNSERVSFEDYMAAPGGDPIAALLSQERAGAVAEAIRQLPGKERLVMPLYYNGELTMKEVGARLGITESRVSQLHTQAIGRLRELLSDFAGEERPEL